MPRFFDALTYKNFYMDTKGYRRRKKPITGQPKDPIEIMEVIEESTQIGE